MVTKQVVLETKSLVKKFSGIVAVDNVSLKVAEGEIKAIIGPNGAGKTTLFNLITGILKPDSGRIILNGRDITRIPLHKRVKLGIGRSFQLTNIFPNLSVLENIEFAVQSSLKRRAGPLEIVNRKVIKERVEDFAGRFGLLDCLGSKAGALTYADQRKIEVIMALALNPEILLFDEPTAGMSSEESFQVMEILKGISKVEDKPILLIEHDIKFVMKTADKITVMHRGKILAEGSPQEIVKNEQVQEVYMGGVFE